MRQITFLFFMIGVILSSCSPQKTIVDTSCPGYKSPQFNRTDIIDNGIGIMPVLGGAEKEQYRRPMGDAIYEEFSQAFGEDNVKSTRDVIRILNENNLANDYSQAINNYTTSGIVPKQMVQKLRDALDVDYLLYTRLLTASEYGEISTGQYTSTTMEVTELYAQTQIWDTNIGDVIWEGKGGSAKLPKNKSDIVKEVAKGLADVVGNQKGQGPCEDKKELIQSVQSATTNTYLAVLGVSSAFSLLLLLAL